MNTAGSNRRCWDDITGAVDSFVGASSEQDKAGRELRTRHLLHQAFRVMLVPGSQGEIDTLRYCAFCSDLLSHPARTWENKIRNVDSRSQMPDDARRILNCLHNLLAIAFARTNKGERGVALAERQIPRKQESQTPREPTGSVLDQIDQAMAHYARALSKRVLGDHEQAFVSIRNSWETISRLATPATGEPNSWRRDGRSPPNGPGGATEEKTRHKWWNEQEFAGLFLAVLEKEMAYLYLSEEGRSQSDKVQNALKYLISASSKVTDKEVALNCTLLALKTLLNDPSKFFDADTWLKIICDGHRYQIWLNSIEGVLKESEQAGVARIVLGSQTVGQVIATLHSPALVRHLLTNIVFLEKGLCHLEVLRDRLRAHGEPRQWIEIVLRLLAGLLEVDPKFIEQDSSVFDRTAEFCVEQLLETRTFPRKSRESVASLCRKLSSLTLLSSVPKTRVACRTFFSQRDLVPEPLAQEMRRLLGDA